MAQATPGASGAPTVVLVHGAFADASGWAEVDASHVAMISQPQATADLILSALGTIG
jgi:hypothetical protein